MRDTEIMVEGELYCSFWLGSQCFGVPAIAIKEARGSTAITPIPGAPPSVSGYVNLRGQLHLAIDPHELLTGDTGSAAHVDQLLVFKASEGEAFAIQVSRVGEILTINREWIDVPKNQDSVARSIDLDHRLARLITGYARLEGLLLTIIEPAALLPAVFQKISTAQDAVQ